jgi:hypothetical protein
VPEERKSILTDQDVSVEISSVEDVVEEIDYDDSEDPSDE